METMEKKDAIDLLKAVLQCLKDVMVADHDDCRCDLRLVVDWLEREE